MSQKELSGYLSDSRDLILGEWAKRTKAASPRYSERPLDEIRENLSALLDGMINYVETGDRSKLDDHVRTRSELRARQGFRLSDTLKAVSIGQRVILDVLRDECETQTDPMHCFGIADTLAELFCEVAMLHAEILEDNRRKASTADMISALADAHRRLDEKEIARHSVENLRTRFNIRACAMVLIESAEPFFAEEDDGQEREAFRLACKKAASRREMVRLEPGASGMRDPQSLIGVPIVLEGQIIGAIAVASDGKAPLTEADISVVTSIASQVAAACDVARRYRGAMTTVGQLDADRSELFTILSALEAAVYVADMETYEILAVNDKLKEGYGSDLVGRKCYEALQEGQTEPCPFCTNHRLIEEGVPSEPYSWKFRNTRTGRWYNCIDKAIPWTDGRHVRIELAYDITELEESRQEAEKAWGQAQLYNDLLLHDLGNYVSTIKGFVDLALEAEGLRDDEKSLISSAASQTTKCARLLDRIRQFSKVQSATDISREPANLNDILDEALAETMEAASETKAEAIKHYEGTEPHNVLVGTFAKEIFLNLLSNAVKFGDGKDFDIFVDEDSIGQTPAWKVTIADHGKGIPPEMRKGIFNRYSRLEPSKKLKGTGLGLSIAKTLVDRYGGDLRIGDRVPGDCSKGASFSVLLPKA